MTRSFANKTLWWALTFAFAPALRAQEPAMPMEHAQSQHEHAPSEALAPSFPQMGLAQAQAKEKLFRLDDAQKLAAANNPTLRQATAEIAAAAARKQQAGLYPNPVVGYTADEIRGGSTGGGKQGFFVQQNIVTGGKLARARDVYQSERDLATIEAEEQKLRVGSAVKSAYFRVLAAQELLETQKGIARIDQEFATVQRQLRNTGQADETEVLSAEIRSERSRIAVRLQENSLIEDWRMLAAVIGTPDLPLAVVSGDLEHGWPDLKEDELLTAFTEKSPAARIAQTATQREAALLNLAKRQSIPDLQLRGGLEYNNEPISGGSRAIGWQGIAEVGVQIPIFNRNQGSVAAATSELDRARAEQQRVALTLRARASTVLDEYAGAKLVAAEYQASLLPLGRKSYSVMLGKYGLMLASYPRVLESQRTLFSLHEEYIRALETVWTTGIALEHFLLTDGLEAPSRPGEVDHPVRETNLPVAESPVALPSLLTQP